MHVPSRRLRNSAVVALTAVMALGLAAGCSKKNDAPAGDGQLKLVVDTFGEFGYKALAKEYESAHPNIKVQLRSIEKLDDYKPKLTQYLAAGSGAGDVVALEEGILTEFKTQPQNFVDLNQFGGGDLAKDYLPWKFEQGKASNGQLIGLPTDVGGLGVCYRRDLFEKAKLPTDRAEVSKLWTTWDDFIATGQRFNAGGSGAAFLDSTTTAFNAMLAQFGDTNFYDRNNNLIADSNPSVRKAWDYTMSMIDKGISAKVTTWSNEWQAGFKNASFAVTFCPSWMRGIIKTNAGDASTGKWDIADVPGGGGNWGGSFLAVPKQSRHAKEAYELAKFLTSAHGQIGAFNESGPLPSNLGALDDATFKATTDPYFNNAPVGVIYGAGAKALKPVYRGPKHQAVLDRAFQPAIQSVEQGKAKADEAWKNALDAAKKEAK
ncbi:ABC transporter substrate-binding protein [Planosporangium mesophilum]|uniref:ABC transporter substrate-binding protein n=1 Tax=Planosporangium mesophilum TaxID=689768 RepID=A0A8J3T9A7_9ACTN|nr:extracellular solute-binding protein [Planosporangium mesophilum]NJC85682.1 extracellular solute-binding protein [Planosporangium mesophilum]GII21421.1 ABC transporter substrate-binding protein [Planosporangium mesophilum]